MQLNWVVVSRRPLSQRACGRPADAYAPADLAAGRADSAGPATGTTVLTDWIRAHGDELGRHYANELDRHFRTGTPEPA